MGGAAQLCVPVACMSLLRPVPCIVSHVSRQVPKFSVEEQALADKSAAGPPPPTASSVSTRVAQLMGGLGLRATTGSDAMGDDDL